MKDYIKENQKIITYIVIWLFIHLIIYIYANNSRSVYYRSEVNDIFPFTEKSLVKTYDVIEFLIYGVAPCIALILIKLNSKDNE